MNIRTVALAIASGILLILAFPKWSQAWLVWIALIPLLYAIDDAAEGEAFRLGFLTGLVFNVGLIYWIVHVVSHYGGLPLYLSLALMVLFALYLALYQGLFALGLAFLRRRGVPFFVSGAFLWTSLEYAKGRLFTGFPWENMGYALHEQLFTIQIADITGVYGLTFLIIIINCLLFDLLRGGERKRALMKAAVVVLLMTVVVSYGAWRIHSVDTRLEAADSVSVALIQGNIDQSIKWHPDYQSETIEIYGELSRAAAQEGVDLIIWPETAMPLFFQDVDDNHRKIVSLVRETSTPLLFGSPGYTTGREGRSLINSAWLLAADGSIAGRYDKMHLVPFGEYVPLRRILFFVDKLVEGFAEFIPGESIDPLDLNDVATGVLICYEGIFPGISRAGVREGADFLVNITNDAWYGRTSAPYQHMSMLPLRAVENRRSVARAANTGISALIDPLGRVTARTEIFERDRLSGSLKLSTVETFYTKYGDVFALLCLAGMALLLLLSMRRRNND